MATFPAPITTAVSASSGVSTPTKSGCALYQGTNSAADKDPGISQVRANTLVGMNEAQAEECAASLRWQIRVGQRDDESFALTKDFRVDRVTITVMQGLVTKVEIG